MSLKKNFLKYLPNWLKTRPDSIKLVDALGDSINSLDEMIKDIKEVQSHISTSSGEALEWWGRDFELFRVAGEDDENYRQRILNYISPDKVRGSAVLKAIKTFYSLRNQVYGNDYLLALDEYQPLSFRVIVKGFNLAYDFEGKLVSEVVRRTRAAGILSETIIQFFTYNVPGRTWMGYMDTNGASQLNSSYTVGGYNYTATYPS